VSGHTPGPWQYMQDGNEPYWSIGMAGGNPAAGNAMVYTCVEDARLIAVAPELLAALKELMELYAAGQMTIEGDNGQDPVIAGAECVIARAEGRSE